MLKNIIALFACDECGKDFEIEMDPADKVSGWSVFEYAENGVRRGGCLFHPWRTSVQDNKHLCYVCTEASDTKEEREQAEREEGYHKAMESPCTEDDK